MVSPYSRSSREWFNLVIVSAALCLSGCARYADLYNHFTDDDGKTLTDTKIHICDPLFVAFTPDVPEMYQPQIAAGFEYWNSLGFPMFKVITEFAIEDPLIPLPVVLVITMAKPNEMADEIFMGTLMASIDEDGCAQTTRLYLSPWMLDLHSDAQITNAARHEAGHLLGLSDRTDDKSMDSLMFERLITGMPYPRDASNEEIAAVKALYPELPGPAIK